MKQVKSAVEVCHITSVHPRTDARIFVKEVLSIRSAGYHIVSVVADGKGDDLENNIYDIGKPINRIHRIFSIRRKLYKKAVKINAQIYHFHDPELLNIGKRLKKKGKVIIYDVHEDLPRQIMTKSYLKIFPQKLLVKFIEKWENVNVKNFNYLITSTEYIKHRMMQNNKNVECIRNYPKISEFVRSEKKQVSIEGNSYACYIGGLSKERGIEEIVKACYILSIKLIIAGRFESIQFQREIEQTPEWENVKFLGMIDRESISDLLKGSLVGFVTLYPTQNYLYSLPVKMYEYMISAIPVLASNFPLWRDIIEKHDCGLCVDPQDTEGIIEAIKYLLENPVKAKKMGENGREAVLRDYNWRREENKLVKIYKSLLN